MEMVGNVDVGAWTGTWQRNDEANFSVIAKLNMILWVTKNSFVNGNYNTCDCRSLPANRFFFILCSLKSMSIVSSIL